MRRPSSYLADLMHGVFHPLGVLVPEGLNSGWSRWATSWPRFLMAWANFSSAAAFLDASRSVVTMASGVPLGANRPTQR